MTWPDLKRTWTENWGFGVVGALGSVLISLPLHFADLGRPLVEFSYDLPFWLSHRTNRTEACVVKMDSASTDRLDQMKNGAAWNRTNLTAFLGLPYVSNAPLVVFDLTLTEPSTNLLGKKGETIDEELARAMREHGHVLLGSVWDLLFKKEIPPVEPFGTAALGYAPVQFPHGSDDGIRQHWPHTNLAWKAAQLFRKNVPIPEENRWINYNDSCRSIWSSSLKPGAFYPTDFTNTVLFVGGSGEVWTPVTLEDRLDVHPTALYKQSLPGVEIHAVAFLNLLHHDWLELIPTSAEMLYVLGVGLVFGFGLIFLRPLVGVALCAGGIAALVGLDLYLVLHQHLWFPWAVTSVVQIPSAMAWACLVHVRRRFRNKGDLTVERSAAGSVVIAHHNLLIKVGEGAYGEVWLARNQVGLLRALKIVRRSPLRR